MTQAPTTGGEAPEPNGVRPVACDASGAEIPESAEALYARLQTAEGRTVAAKAFAAITPESLGRAVQRTAQPDADTGLQERRAPPFTNEERARMALRIASLAERLPTMQQRRAVVDAVATQELPSLAPELFASSNRINAQAVADGLGLPLERLANALGTTATALVAEPDAQSLQAALMPVARVVAGLGIVPAEQREAWLTHPHRLIDGRAPLDLVLGGEAERVALLLETAINGGG